LLIVTNAADSGPGTLRDRVASANANDSIHFGVNGPVLLASPIAISKNLIISGPTGSGFKISGNNATRVFNITAGSVLLSSLTIGDGRVAGTMGSVGGNGENVFGGAILISNGARLHLTQCVLSNNVALGGAGGAQGQFGFAGIGGNGFGGAIGNFGVLFLSRCIVSVNFAAGGDGGSAPTGSPGSGGQGWGGAIYSEGSADIQMSTLHANYAMAGVGDGGAGGGSGGAVYNVGLMNIAASTIVSNTAGGSGFDFGGGINNYGQLTVRDSTIVGNQATYGGGVSGGNYGNTIIAGNSAGFGPDGTGLIESDDFNFIQNTNGMSLSGTVTHNILGQNPLLGPLQHNGSLDLEFTPPNMAPLPSSPVIDKGRNYESADQRLFARPYDGSIANGLGSNGADIGAIEIRPSSLLVINNNNSGPGSLRQALTENNNLGGGNTIYFASNLTGTITLSGAELTITAPTIIAGPGADKLTVSGNNSVRVFTVLRGPAQINGLTISDGLSVGSPGQQGQDGFDGRGAGIYNQDVLMIGGCIIRSNRAVGGIGGERHLGNVGRGGKGMGAGVYNASGNVTLNFCSLENNSATGGQGGPSLSGEAGDGGNALGGAISTGGGTLEVHACKIMNNAATGGAGGVGGQPGTGGQGYGGNIYNESLASVTYSAAAGGSAMGGAGGGGTGSGYGGGIYNLNTLWVTLSTIASNNAGGSSFDFGGGIYNLSTLMLTNVTIAGNQADYGGGLHGNADAVGSLFGANIANASGADVSGTLNSYDFNLIQSFGGLNIVGATGNIIIGQDPLLGPLTNNGGFAPTMALRPGSPAIDKSKNVSFLNDQRGAPRPFDFESIPNAAGGDGSDIGAFELGQPLLKITRESTQVVLSWPEAYGDFVLESNDALPGDKNWTVVTNTPVIGPAEQFYVTPSAALGNQFFRLRSR
jgi:hypothetical protein